MNNSRQEKLEPSAHSIKRLLLATLLLLIIQTSFSHTKPDNASVDYSYNVIPSVNNTWGYDIYTDNKLKIHQPNIPGKSGNEGFKRKENAEKVAKLVIEKMKNGEMPPTVTKEELENLGI